MDDAIMTTIFPGSAVISCEALLQNARIIPGEEKQVVYDCAIPLLFTSSDGNVMLCSLCNHDFSVASASLFKGVFEIEARVSS